MSDVVIKVENLSKQYRLGTVGTGTLSHDLNRWWYKVRGKEDPYLKIGDSNDRASKGESEYVWALKDINFEVKQGEVLGIIGKNGAGKSTLLKILSKVTGPTTGSIKAKGRIASLLEVGTGFHPELTGRENIYLNGTILGMTKREVDRKLDEIVDFAGVARYLDTPVKRYSSGMKVRLGFAVAAHLEPEILVVDEVLAVGDAEFQKKAIGKMQEVSREGGRTVLFVSHNMASVTSLCKNAILLKDGSIEQMGEVNAIVDSYLRLNSGGNSRNIAIWNKENALGNDTFKVLRVEVRRVGGSIDDAIRMDDEILIECLLQVNDLSRRLDTTFQIKDETGRVLFPISSAWVGDNAEIFIDSENEKFLKTNCTIPGSFFNEGEFLLNLLVIEERQKVLMKELDIVGFTVTPKPVELGSWMGKAEGALKPSFKWERKILQNPN